MKITLTGARAHNKLYLSGLARAGVKSKRIPAFFTIEIDTCKIRERVQSKEACTK